MIDLRKIGITHDELIKAYQNKEEIINFVGGIEVETGILNKEVPENFPNPHKVKLFKEYCNNTTNKEKTKSILIIGFRDENGNRKKVVSSKEFYIWADHFGIENIMTKSEMITKLKHYIDNDLLI